MVLVNGRTQRASCPYIVICIQTSIPARTYDGRTVMTWYWLDPHERRLMHICRWAVSPQPIGLVWAASQSQSKAPKSARYLYDLYVICDMLKVHFSNYSRNSFFKNS